MKLTLKRYEFNENGIFGHLTVENNVFHTLEHAYPVDNTCKPKIPVGEYTCKRGTYPKNGETFEVMNVPNHTFILVHVGNYNKDSNGCILVGLDRSGDMITSSKKAFTEFMKLMDGLNEFELEVI